MQTVAPLQVKGAHEHDGFYLRLGLGFDYLAFDVVQRNQLSNVSATAHGGGLALDIAIGGAVAPGLVLAGVFLTSGALTPRSTNARGGNVVATTDHPFEFGQSSLVGIGLLADWYIDPKSGWHVLGALSIAGFAMEDSSSRHTEILPDGTQQSVPDVKNHSSAGGSFTFGGGYEWWIADQWSLGPILRFTYAATKSSDDQWSHRAWSSALLLGGTYQ